MERGGPDAGRGELHREGQAVQLVADRRDRGDRRAVQAQPRSRRTHAIDEQVGGIGPLEVGDGGGRRTVQVRQREGRDLPDHLARQPERLAAGDDGAAPGAHVQDRFDQPGDRGQEVLGVVEDQQDRPLALQVPGELVEEIGSRRRERQPPGPPARTSRSSTASVVAPSGTTGASSIQRTVSARPLGLVRRTRVHAASSARRVLPQPPAPVSVTRRCRSLRPATVATSSARPTNERPRRRQVVVPRWRRGDGPVERDQVRGRFGPDLLEQAPAVVLEGAERVDLAARTRQRLHEQAARAVAERVLGEQGLEPRDGRGPVVLGEVALDEILHRGDAQLLEPVALGRCPQLVAELGVGLAVPEAPAPPPGCRRVVGGVVATAGRGEELLEAERVDLVR